MIRIIVDNKEVYTDSQQLKITRENPFIKTGTDFTLDVSFPLSIPENLRVFGPVNRLDVSKKSRTFKDCFIYVDNRLLLKGNAHVTSYSETVVKLQFVAGNYGVKYSEYYDTKYIDEIDYPEVAEIYRNMRCDWRKPDGGNPDVTARVTADMESQGFVGEAGKYCFCTLFDETENNSVNVIYKTRIEGEYSQMMIERPAVQPNLLYVFQRVIATMGYTADLSTSGINAEPWSRIYIASAVRTAKIRTALPHWKFSTFLDEFRKFFNVSLIFDEGKKTVTVVSADSVSQNDVVNFETLDEFTSEYDEDGLEYHEASNLRFNLRDSSERYGVEDISDEVFDIYDVLEVDNVAVIRDGLENGTISRAVAEKTLYHCFRGYFYVHYVEEGEEVTDTPFSSQEGDYIFRWAGCFTRLKRDGNADNTVELNIVPAPTRYGSWYEEELVRGVNVLLPSTENENAGLTDYAPIQEVLEGGSAAGSDDTESERMEGFFVCGSYNPIDTRQVDGRSAILACVPRCLTDAILYPQGYQWSFSLNSLGNGIAYLGQLHQNSYSISGHFAHNIKYLCDGLPDPTKIYNFNGKRYLASKIEVEVVKGEIERIKSGEFFEIG